ncbi:MAG TPA: hypothetical protein VFQ91_12140 [Bryobacteraceae bacterium]|nr:hypothetical protein [Bryobacteraceae bacterium]
MSQEIQFTGPLSGLVFDGPSHSLRQVLGMPGAAVLGPPVAGGIDWATVAPNGQRAIILREGQATLLSLRNTPSESPLLSQVNEPLYASWMPDSSAVALYYSASASLQWIRLTPEGPEVDALLPLAWTPPAEVSDFLAGNPSQSAVLAVPGHGLYKANSAGEVTLVYPATGGLSIAAQPGTETLWIADRANGQLVQITNSESQVLIASPETLTDLSAIGLSSDGAKLYLANQGTNRLYLFDRTTSAVTGEIELYAPATRFTTLGRPSILLLGQRTKPGETLYVLDEKTGPTVFFVPASEEQ